MKDNNQEPSAKKSHDSDSILSVFDSAEQQEKFMTIIKALTAVRSLIEDYKGDKVGMRDSFLHAVLAHNPIDKTLLRGMITSILSNECSGCIWNDDCITCHRLNNAAIVLDIK